jgi:hypothetical protein
MRILSVTQLADTPVTAPGRFSQTGPGCETSLLSADLALLLALHVPNQDSFSKFLIRNGLSVLFRSRLKLPWDTLPVPK